MRITKSIFWAVAFGLFLFTMASCAGTKLTSVWNDKAYGGGSLKKIMVVGVFEKTNIRRIFEDEMVGYLESQGTSAISSAAVIPAEKELNAASIKAAAAKLGADAVLVTHLEKLSEESVHYPRAHSYYNDPYYNRFGSYYPSVHRHVYTGYTAKYKKVLLETNLYEIRTEKLLWSAESETFDPQSANALVKSLAKQIIKSLKDSNLIN